MKRQYKVAVVAASILLVGVVGVTGIRLPEARADDPVSPSDIDGNQSLDPSAAPGGNFDLRFWELQMPTGSHGNPDTITSRRLQGTDGFTDPAYFWTDKHDGSMTFWVPEHGATTKNSHFARTELREMNPQGGEAAWTLHQFSQMTGRLRVVSVTKNVCVAQIHLSDVRTTKPLAQLYYRRNGDILLGIEKSPSGQQDLYEVGNVPIGQTWTYSLGISDYKILLRLNDENHSFDINHTFRDQSYLAYFKAGAYNQSSVQQTADGTKVKYSKLAVIHQKGPNASR